MTSQWISTCQGDDSVIFKDRILHLRIVPSSVGLLQRYSEKFSNLSLFKNGHESLITATSPSISLSINWKLVNCFPSRTLDFNHHKPNTILANILVSVDKGFSSFTYINYSVNEVQTYQVVFDWYQEDRDVQGNVIW